MQVPVPALGPRVFQEFPQGGPISDARIGRNGMATGIRYRQGLVVRKVGPIRQQHAPTRVWRSSGVSREHVMAGLSARHMEWRSYHSHAYCGWARQPPSDVVGHAEGAWGFTPLSVTHTSSE